MLNPGEVECGGRVPCTTGDGKDVDVNVCGRDVLEFELGLNNTEVSGIHALGPPFVNLMRGLEVGLETNRATLPSLEGFINF